MQLPSSLNSGYFVWHLIPVNSPILHPEKGSTEMNTFAI